VNYNEAKPLIHAYTDGELGLESALEIERHLEECADCARERASLAALSAVLGDPALRYSVPDALRRLGAALAAAMARRRRQGQRHNSRQQRGMGGCGGRVRDARAGGTQRQSRPVAVPS
jgi:anti-sigma factor RsiW